jgi:dTDP-4-dehydrorhamnose 3,5-epimerase-like enzyme
MWMSLDQCRLIDFPRIEDARGNLTFIEGLKHIPFEIKRVYYLYDVPGGATRAAHAHKTLQQIVIAMSGSFDVSLDDGRDRRRFQLNRSYVGLYIPPMIWRDIDNFSSGSVCMALASDYFSEQDYYRGRAEFIAALGVADA